MLFILLNLIYNSILYYYFGISFLFFYHGIKYLYFSRSQYIFNFLYVIMDFMYSFYNILYYNLLKVPLIKNQYKKLVLYDEKINRKILNIAMKKLNKILKSIITQEKVVKIDVEEDTEDEDSDEEYSKVFLTKKEEEDFLKNIKKIINK